MMSSRSPRRPVLAVLCMLLLGACAAPSEPTRFYTLEPAAPAQPEVPRLRPSPSAPPLSIGLGPLRLPDLLERPQIVNRNGSHQVVLAEFDQWAGNLRDAVYRQMAAQLMGELQTALVAIEPWSRARTIDYELQLEVLRFDGAPGDSAMLQGVWRLLDGRTGSELRAVSFQHSAPVPGDDQLALVGTLSRLLARLTREIGQGILAQAQADGSAEEVPPAAVGPAR